MRIGCSGRPLNTSLASMWKRVALPALLFASTVCLGGGGLSAKFTVDPKVLRCEARPFGAGESLKISLGERHGRELGIERTSDHSFYWLIVESYGERKGELMPSARFRAAKKIELPAGLLAPTNDGTVERVFTVPGTYIVYVSENLESENGGHKCEVNYRG